MEHSRLRFEPDPLLPIPTWQVHVIIVVVLLTSLLVVLGLLRGLT